MWQGWRMPSAPDIVAFVDQETRKAIEAILDYVGSDPERATDAQELIAMRMTSTPDVTRSEQFERMAAYDVMSAVAARLSTSNR
ncbi:MAG: hypothetical protein RL238_2803 [Actinomycetota bacterium]|jgi:hypothetical protein